MQENKKFIGGAEIARRQARKRRWEPNGRQHNKKHGKSNNSKGSYSRESFFKNLSPSQKFFSSLLSHKVQSFLDVYNEDCGIEKTLDGFGKRRSNSSYDQLISEICFKANVHLPKKISATYANKKEFYSSRKSLVLEESRCILSNELFLVHKRRRWDMQMKLIDYQDQKKTGVPLLVFEKAPNLNRKYSRMSRGPSRLSFTNTEMSYMRPGHVFEIRVAGQNIDEEETSVLATVLPGNMSSGTDNCSKLTLMVFRKDYLENKIAPNSLWQARPVTTLISEARQFEACQRSINVSFMPTILGWKDSSHIRFDDSEDSEDESLNNVNKHPFFFSEEEKRGDSTSTVFEILSNCDDNSECNDSNDNGVLIPFQHFSLPSLNPTQEKAATQFLKSKESTVTLIQGPPGTGKTTFLVSVIFMSLWYQKKKYGILLDPSKRVLVTAPTNKAITVIASKFIDIFHADIPINVVMIGVEDKLVPDGRFSKTDHNGESDPASLISLPNSLRSIFVYTWIDSVVSQYLLFDKKLYLDSCLNQRIENMIYDAGNLERRLSNSIPRLASQSLVLEASAMFLSSLESITNSVSDKVSTNQMTIQLKESKMHCKTVIERLNEIDQSEVVQELLFTANVIFCTLSSSGVYSMKTTSQIDDLFVDEAAAATEIELCIPFHLHPKRMLAVGDPKQLPATVISHRAMRLGLDKSLHERLMIECRKEYVMLNVQYRMKPDICQLPSNYFYDGKIMNGQNVISKDYKSCTHILKGHPYTFFQVFGKEFRGDCGSFYNDSEAELVLTLVSMFKNTSNLKSPNDIWFSPDKIRIITFYQGQVKRIQSLLSKHGLGGVLVATVDSSQGCEADIVIVSFVRSNKKNGNSRQRAGFLTDDRRINVALTRAKYQLICIGDALGTLICSGDPTLKAIVDDAKDRSFVRNIKEELPISSYSSTKTPSHKKKKRC